MVAPAALPDIYVLQEWFALDEQSGALYWQKKPAKRIKAGAEAGWTQNHNGLLRVSVQVPQHGRYLRSRVVWKLFHGSEPPAVVDHIDRNPLNDAPGNLRDGTNGVNGRNRAPRSASGLMGAFPSANKDGRWQSTIQHNRKTVYLGVFETALEANAAYLEALDRIREGKPPK